MCKQIKENCERTNDISIKTKRDLKTIGLNILENKYSNYNLIMLDYKNLCIVQETILIELTFKNLIVGN